MKRFIATLLCSVLFTTVIGQVSIMSASLNSLNITGSSLFDVTVVNGSTNSVSGVLSVTLVNSGNEIICSGKSQVFTLTPGLNRLSTQRIGIAEFTYGASQQAGYVRTFHNLPAGTFKYCAYLSVLSGAESPDEFCEEIESNTSSFLDLVSPYDKEEIDTKNPVLIWTHSEPFNILSQGEFFRILVTEMKEGQSPDASVTTNNPIFFRDNLKTHQVPYPGDAPELTPEKRYAWQVEKIQNGVIIQKTEAWEFHLKPPTPPTPHQYVVMSNKPNAGYYEPSDDMLYFAFDEGYDNGIIDCSIYNDQRNKTVPKSRDDSNELAVSSIKTLGDNRFAIDLSTYHLKKGFYTLEVKNIKSEIVALRFYVKN